MNKMKELIGMEMSMVELDNKMVELGFSSEGEYLDSHELVESGSIMYCSSISDYTVVINFEILQFFDDSCLSDTFVKILDIF